MLIANLPVCQAGWCMWQQLLLKGSGGLCVSHLLLPFFHVVYAKINLLCRRPQRVY